MDKAQERNHGMLVDTAQRQWHRGVLTTFQQKGHFAVLQPERQGYGQPRHATRYVYIRTTAPRGALPIKIREPQGGRSLEEPPTPDQTSLSQTDRTRACRTHHNPYAAQALHRRVTRQAETTALRLRFSSDQDRHLGAIARARHQPPTPTAGLQHGNFRGTHGTIATRGRTHTGHH